MFFLLFLHSQLWIYQLMQQYYLDQIIHPFQILRLVLLHYQFFLDFAYPLLFFNFFYFVIWHWQSLVYFFYFFGGACSETSFFFFFNLFYCFFAFGAKGILVLSVIWINSTDTIGGRSMGFLAKNGKLIAVIIIKIKCKTEDIIILLFTFITFLCMVQK